MTEGWIVHEENGVEITQGILQLQKRLYSFSLQVKDHSLECSFNVQYSSQGEKNTAVADFLPAW